MRAKIFISVFLFMGFGEALLSPKEIEARLQSLELAKSEFEVEIDSLRLSDTKLNKEVNQLKTQVAELLESKCESEMDKANQTLENVCGMTEDVQDQAECEYGQITHNIFETFF